MYKKGLSTIIATLLMILLTLVAVGTVGIVVKNILNKNVEKADLGKLTLDLEIEKVTIKDNNVAVVVLRRNPGKGEFVGMNFVFSNGTHSEIIRRDVFLEELDKKEFLFGLRDLSVATLETISVVPIYKLYSGKESIGDVADEFEVSDKLKEGITGRVISNFEKKGFRGTGVIEYKVSSSSDNAVQFKKVIVNPLDVYVGDWQEFTVEVYSVNGISEVITTTQLDNDVLDLPLVKLSEDDKGIEKWSAGWTVYDTHETTYETTFIATDNLGNSNSVTIGWSDPTPCTDLNDHEAAFFLTVDCTLDVGIIEGIDSGNITISSGVTLTLSGSSSFIFTPGYSIIIKSGATIAISGGSIRKAYLFYPDADGGNYSPTSTRTWSSSPSYPGYVRAASTLGTNDCYDSNANAYPGQTSSFTTNRGDGSYDYNCDGSTTVGTTRKFMTSTTTVSGTPASYKSSTNTCLFNTLYRYGNAVSYTASNCGQTYSSAYNCEEFEGSTASCTDSVCGSCTSRQCIAGGGSFSVTIACK